jgi:hypothetical protein
MSVASRIATLIGIGTTAGERVWAVQSSASPLAPYIIFQPIVSTPVNTHEAVSTLSSALVQVSCYGLTYTAAINLRAQVRALLEGHHADGPITVESERETYEQEATPGLHRADIDVNVWTNG